MGNRSIWSLKIVAVLLGLLCGWLVGCSHSTPPALPSVTQKPTPPTLPPVIEPRPTETMRMIAVETLDQGDSYTAELDIPTIFVAGSPAEAARFTKWLNDASVARRIKEVNFNNSLVVAVFFGRTGSSGYGITIQQLRLTSGRVQVMVNLIEPTPGQNVLAIISYPYHIITIPRSELRVVPGTIWFVYAPDGTLLAQTKYP